MPCDGDGSLHLTAATAASHVAKNGFYTSAVRREDWSAKMSLRTACAWQHHLPRLFGPPAPPSTHARNRTGVSSHNSQNQTRLSPQNQFCLLVTLEVNKQEDLSAATFTRPLQYCFKWLAVQSTHIGAGAVVKICAS